MPRPKPNAIGECCCPADEGCDQVLTVYRYARRSDRPSMFKDKYFASCPTHGRVIDALRPASQEHFLNRGTVWGPDHQSTEPAAPALPQKKPVLSRPAPEPAQPAVPVPAPAEEPPPSRQWWQGWNLWEWWTAPSD